MGAKVPFALSEDKYHEKLATTLDKMFENCKDCDIYTKCKNENAFCQYNTLRGDEYIPFYAREIHKYLSGDVNYKVRNGKIYYVLQIREKGGNDGKNQGTILSKWFLPGDKWYRDW